MQGIPYCWKRLPPGHNYPSCPAVALSLHKAHVLASVHWQFLKYVLAPNSNGVCLQNYSVHFNYDHCLCKIHWIMQRHACAIADSTKSPSSKLLSFLSSLYNRPLLCHKDVEISLQSWCNFTNLQLLCAALRIYGVPRGNKPTSQSHRIHPNLT